MDFRLTEEQNSFSSFASLRRLIRPHVREWRSAAFPVRDRPTLASLGLMGIRCRYGGAGMSAINYCICIEELARVDPALALSVAAHNGLCSPHIFSSETKRRSKASGPLARAKRSALKTDGVHPAVMPQECGQWRRGRNPLDAERFENVHDARPQRRHHGRHGRHRPIGPCARDFRLRLERGRRA
jgi:alkylation response protein AidB-like acyl-CoA dehydrogenase